MPFDLLSLPQEIQDRIYAYYLECQSLTVTAKYGRFSTSTICIRGCPSLAIELACWKVSTDVRKLRSQLWPRLLSFDFETVPSGLLALVGTDDKYQWLHRHIQHISVKRPCCLRPTDSFNFRSLQHLTIYGVGCWSVNVSTTSFAAFRRTSLADTDIWIDYANYYVDYVGAMSGGRGTEIDLTLVGKVVLRNPDSVVEVHSALRYARDERRRLQPYLISTKFIAEGKELEAENDDRNGLLAES